MKRQSPSNEGPTPADASRLHRTVWRWHFFAGMIVAPVLIVTATTGALYVLRDEIEPLLYSSMLIVEPGSVTRAATYQQQLDEATKAAPSGSRLILAETPPVTDTPTNRATLFRFKLADGDQRFVYVDPYTGNITGTIDRSRQFFEVVLKLHRQLYAGTTGRVIVELTTCWAIVLAFSGLYLWAPRGRNRGGVWRPRLSGARYTAVRDLHVIPAVLLSPMVFVILASGLFFSVAWGTGYRLAAASTNGFPKTFTSPPKSDLPRSGEAALPRISLDDSIRAARDSGYTDNWLRTLPPKGNSGAFIVSARNERGPSVSGQLYVDQYSGKVLLDSRDLPTPVMTKALLYALPIHQGSVLGLPTKVLALMAALGMMASCVTGYWMWWTRRPSASLGIPRRYEGVRTPAWMMLVIVSLCVLLPALAASLIVVCVADYCWLRFRRWLTPTVNTETSP